MAPKAAKKGSAPGSSVPKPRRGGKSAPTAAPVVIEPVPATPPQRTAPALPAEPDGEEFDFQEADMAPVDSDEEPPRVNVITSPIKRRARRAAPTINRLTDLEVWGMTDEEIIDAAKSTWRSDVYDHYTVTIRRNLDDHQEPLSMTYLFTCATHPEHHTSVFSRSRMKTGDGTSNLQKGLDMCLRKQGKSRPKPAASAIPYSEANHRALTVLRCAKYGRPINMVQDEEYLLEVEMLRPGTKVPKPMTVQRDLLWVYAQASIMVKSYFMQLGSTVHAVLDGWTSPLVSSYLGLVIVWFDKGIIHRTILEFIRLTKKHDGRYLAEVTADCLKRFGLDKNLLGLCMDNASNCNKLAELLPDFIPSFWGEDGRLRCLAHIFNLIAKIFISFFFKKPKVKKTVTFTAEHEEVVEVIVDPGDESEDDDPVIAEEAAAEAMETEEDDGQVAHDDEVAKSLRDIAIQEMRASGVVMSAAENRMALKLFPVVSGLARRIHDASLLNEKFQELIDQDPEHMSNKRALDRRVPTRWNADFDCIAAHLQFKNIIQAMTGVSGNKLQAYRLTDEQWDLAEDVVEVLKLFKDATLLFSQAEVPLIVETIPMLFQIRDSLQAAALDTPQTSDDDADESISTSSDTPAVIRIAAHASVLLIEKYINLIWNCEIYVIAIVMCPDRKLAWLKSYVDNQQLKEIKKLVIARWTESYQPAGSQIPVLKKDDKAKSKWAAPSKSSSGQYPPDHIQTYLKDPITSPETIQDAGGYMKYWYQMSTTRPNLARMGQDFCSAPATSVDAERAFSTGRRQVNHMQHNMSSQTFKARMALGSWAKTPIFPKFSDIATMVEERMNSGSSDD